MNARYHPAEDVLWDYYRGALKPGLSLVVRAHLEQCPHCRGHITLFDDIGGAMIERIEGVAMADNALDLALARIERPDAPAEAPLPVDAGPKAPPFVDGIDLPQALTAARIHGRRWVAPGVWLARIDVIGAGKSPTYLLRVPPGMAMPVHTHSGREITLVLKGRFSDHVNSYDVGDFVCCDGENIHAPAAAADSDCVCLIAQEEPIVPLTWLGRMLQPLAQI